MFNYASRSGVSGKALKATSETGVDAQSTDVGRVGASGAGKRRGYSTLVTSLTATARVGEDTAAGGVCDSAGGGDTGDGAARAR